MSISGERQACPGTVQYMPETNLSGLHYPNMKFIGRILKNQRVRCDTLEVNRGYIHARHHLLRQGAAGGWKFIWPIHSPNGVRFLAPG